MHERSTDKFLEHGGYVQKPCQRNYLNMAWRVLFSEEKLFPAPYDRQPASQERKPAVYPQRVVSKSGDLHEVVNLKSPRRPLGII